MSAFGLSSGGRHSGFGSLVDKLMGSLGLGLSGMIPSMGRGFGTLTLITLGVAISGS